MTQFTVETLSRLLANVQREVLVDALEAANLTQLLRTDTIETIDQLQSFMNLASNLAVFGPAILRRYTADQLQAEVAFLFKEAPAFAKLVSFVTSLADVGEDILTKFGPITDLINDIKAILAESQPEDAAVTSMMNDILIETNAIFIAANQIIKTAGAVTSQLRPAFVNPARKIQASNDQVTAVALRARALFE